MYRVIEFFTDLHDKDHPYQVGDTFPRDGIKVTEKRLAELAGKDNKRGTPLIALSQDETDTPDQEVESANATVDQGSEAEKVTAPRKRRGTK